MIEIAFVACLEAQMSTCRKEQLLFSDVPLMVCMLQAQTQLAQWSESHLGWKITRWTCAAYDPSRVEA
ncbi:hypothetical protein [Oceaniglobus roseus]|uniref:hypothetical protein n=1 Tax=Oceaniglobus roseus TaxID=1737570 RepID=UPI000C7F5691|nr:hypothetical protein [Kandeliimicrobium roseum]